jgi:hypothetical protein
MSTESSYNLQQSLYTLYRKYYHSGNVTLLKQADFEHGTLQIQAGGLYVLCEDIVFGPDRTYADTVSAYATNKAYRMGFFAAITIECDDVILDLQGCTIRQSYEHYCHQRFFNVIELANAPFITEQGPALVNQSASASAASKYPYVAANNCLLINGTIGLSSHGGVHGNNNCNVLLQNLTVQDFETTGIQLNGVRGAFVDGVTLVGITIAPLNSLTFSFMQHAKALRKLVASGATDTYTVVLGDACANSETLDPEALLLEMGAIHTALELPFRQADAAHATHAALKTSAPSVTSALRKVWAALKAVGAPAELSRYVARESTLPTTTDGSVVACPDGSAIHGILIHKSGVAIGEISDGCGKNGGLCCPMQANTQKGNRGAENVTVQNCTVRNLLLRAGESVGLFSNGAFVRDHTSAVLDLVSIVPNSVLERARVLVNRTKPAPWKDCIARLLLFDRETYSLSAFLDDAEDADAKFEVRYNIDLMAHVSKGVFGVRAEDTAGLTLQGVTVCDTYNLSDIVPPRIAASLPRSMKSVPHITMRIDQTSDYAYGGADSRGLFLGNCKNYLIAQTTLSNARTSNGLCNGVEISLSHNGNVSRLLTSNLHGLVADTLHVHNNCSQLVLCEIHNDGKNAQTYRAFLQRIAETVDAIDGESTAVQKEAAFREMSVLMRLPSTDTNLLAFESPASIHQLQLC